MLYPVKICAVTVAIACVSTTAWAVESDYLRPARVVAVSNVEYPSSANEYAANRAIDGDPYTFCCLLDDTADGANAGTIPPNGSAPVTGRVVFDLGRRVPVHGVRLTARASGGSYNPRKVHYSSLANWPKEDDPSPPQETILVQGHHYQPLSQGEQAIVRWAEVETQYIVLQVHTSYEAGPQHFNYQIAEIDFLVRAGTVPPEPPDTESDPLALECLRSAVHRLYELHSQAYPGAEMLKQIDALQDALNHRRPETTGEMNRPWRDRLSSLQYDALVRNNPFLTSGKLLFVKRYTYQTGWYYSEFMQAGRCGGNVCVLTLEDGSVTELLPELRDGIFDRIDLSFDGQRVAFGYRPAPGQAFRLYEKSIDGGGLRQLTFDPADEGERLASYGLTPARNELGPWRGHTDDFHPCYLPDGGICFASTRCERGVLCDQADNLSVNTLYRIDADGSGLRCLSQGALSESTPSIMPDGRILYTRWEYVDKGVIAVQSLWAMRPDGSGAVEIFGNQHEFPPVLIHGRAIPGTNDRFVCTSTMHHPFAVGPILKLDVRRDIRTLEPIQSLTPDTGLWIDGVGGFPNGESYTHRRNGRWVRDNRGPLFCDPYPLSDEFFLVSCNPDRAWNDPAAYGLWLIDTFGNRVRIYDDPETSCWQPMPLESRFCPPDLPASAAGDCEETLDTATVLLQDVYAGLEGVERGEVKYLRILEQVARPWTAHRFWPDDASHGQNAIISLNAHIYVKLLHGVVPVEEDGSAHFTVPAERNLFFQALDDDYQEVQRMRTFVNFQAGETRACIGCHESRRSVSLSSPSLAWMRAASRPMAQPGEKVPRALSYVDDIQPILDEHCIRCHDGQRPEIPLDLTGGLTTYFNRSYETIMQGQWIAYIQEFQGPQPRAQKTNVTPLQPKALGSHASRLMQVLHAGHYDVELRPEQRIRLVTWVDANGPYYGSYFGRRNLKYQNLPDFRPTPQLDEAGRMIPVNNGH